MSGLDPSLVAGIDPEFIRARLKNKEDATIALKSLLFGFEQEKGDFSSTEADDYLSNLRAASQAENGLTEQAIRLAGLSADSVYAHASKNIKIGQDAEAAFNAVSREMRQKSSMLFQSEVKTTTEAAKIAENILDQFMSMEQEASSILAMADGQTEDISETVKAMASVRRQIAGEKVKSMIIAGAESSEGTTVQDILDNMERLTYTQRYRNARAYEKLTTSGVEENQLIQMFDAARNARIQRALTKQGVKTSLFEQFDDMMIQARGDSAIRKDLLDHARGAIEAFRTGTRTVSEDDHKLAAALLQSFNEMNLRDSGLSDDAIQVVRNMIMLSSANRNLGEYSDDVRSLLSFGGRANPAGFAPPPVDLTDEERRAILSGLSDDTPDVSPSVYKRLTSNWQETKLGQLFAESPMIKKSAYATVGLIAASFIYAAKKDRGEQEIAGPPLLPGGSAYESMPQREARVPSTSMFSGYNQGTGYSVHLEGSQEEIEAYTQAAGSVAQGPINSTMSRGIPMLGRDNFSQIASSF